MSHSRVVCLNCIDGRVQMPVINWIKEHFDIDYVDMITEPGMDGFLANNNNSVEDIYRKIQVSIDCNGAKMIFVVGHADCKGNPVGDDIHMDQIHQAVVRLREEFITMDIKGVWMDSEFKGGIV